MWNNSQWEQENQELLKEWYLNKVTGKRLDSAVRKIHCEGCESVSVNGRTVLAAAAAMLVCVVLCAGMPFIRLRKMEPVDMIKGGSDDLQQAIMCWSC